MNMKKLSTVLLIVLLLVLTTTLFACNKGEDQDNSPLTINVPNNSKAYWLELKDYIKKDLGIDIELKFEYQEETSTHYLQEAKNGNSTDIIFSVLTPSKEVLENYYLDLSDTAAANVFSSILLNKYSINKHVYRLPISSQLIGITYNKTLFEEQGWETPTNLQELQALAIEVENAGYEFSSSNNAATGFGWNYLFNFAGSEYINTIQGTRWFSDFVSGEETQADNLMSSLDYLEDLKDLGMFGTITSKWDSSYTTSHRCAFYVGILAGAQSYNGYRVGADGNYVGATCFQAIIKEDGTFTSDFVMTENATGKYAYVDGKYVVYDADAHQGMTRYNSSVEGKLTCLFEVEEDANGPLVWYKNGFNSSYVYYDSNNSSYNGLTRYKVKGDNVEYLTDEYAIMPFISSNGTNNCFVCYDSGIYGLNKNLSKSNQKERLKKAEKVLEYIATNGKVLALSLSTPSSYIGTSTFTIDESRMYYDYKEDIENGLIMDWYYNYFDGTVINTVGEAVNNYLAGKAMTIGDQNRVPTKQDIIDMLESAQAAVLNNTVEVYGKMGECLSLEQTAEFLIKSSAIELQKEINKSHNDVEVQVAMIPYAHSLYLNDINDASNYVVRTEAQKDDITNATLKTYYAKAYQEIVAIKLTGAEIKQMQKDGYDAYLDSSTNTMDKWLVVTKNNIKLDDNTTYVVAMPKVNLQKTYPHVLDGENTPVSILIPDAILSQCKALGTICLKDIKF